METEHTFHTRHDFTPELGWAAFQLLAEIGCEGVTVEGMEEGARTLASPMARRSDLRPRSLGVLQGHNASHLKFCLDTYLANGVPHLGFGSFDTGGVNAEINLFTAQSSQRLEVLRDLLEGPYLRGEQDVLPSLHLFGVSSPALMAKFPRFLATSFDSSGWMRTAGYGNVYLPFQSRRNVTHGASALSCGTGLSAAAFYTACAESGHECPFCRDFDRIRRDRYARMLHNAIVFREMTARLNDGLPGEG